MLFFSDVGLHILQQANDIFVGNVLFYLVFQWKIGIRDSILKQDQILRNRIVTKIVIFIEWSTRFSGLGGGWGHTIHMQVTELRDARFFMLEDEAA